MTTFIIGMILWSLTGVGIAALLARQGHNFWVMAVAGVPYGPLLLVLHAVGFSGRSAATRQPRELSGTTVAGSINVLVGLDGTDHSIESAVSWTSRPVAELVNGPATTIDQRADLKAAARALANYGVGLLVVTDEAAEVAGVLSERDLIWALSNGVAFDDATVAEFMTTEPRTMEPTDSLGDVITAMAVGSCRHVLVDQPGNVGVVSATDLLSDLSMELITDAGASTSRSLSTEQH